MIRTGSDTNMSKLIKLLILLTIAVKSCYWEFHAIIPFCLFVASMAYATELLQDYIQEEEEIL